MEFAELGARGVSYQAGIVEGRIDGEERRAQGNGGRRIWIWNCFGEGRGGA